MPDIWLVYYFLARNAQATAPTTISASWLTAGFDNETRDAATYLIVNETKIRQGDAFRDVWLFDYHPLRTPKKRASQKWGPIDEHLFRKTEKIPKQVIN
jgi:hypothetical protein